MESIAGKSIRELTITHLSSEDPCIQFFIEVGLQKSDEVNPRRNTWFAKNGLSFSDNLLLLYCCVYDFSIELAIRENFRGLRSLIIFVSFGNSCFNDRQRSYPGQGVEVEIDESLFYKRKYNRGRILGSGWYFGAVERHDHSKSFLMIVPNHCRTYCEGIDYNFRLLEGIR
ncbi:hypothetical protein RF11_06117 [Thelohanellus kitauei]|uniref:Uncharacterized protein n=1 Tax=Thelohanellus kitauei TaxID=669202 RepID=A0A0C2M993_THEKT|nr:hypothetical protein RF11_06117 [Thelohanellus kitauei]